MTSESLMPRMASTHSIEFLGTREYLTTPWSGPSTSVEVLNVSLVTDAKRTSFENLMIHSFPVDVERVLLPWFFASDIERLFEDSSSSWTNQNWASVYRCDGKHVTCCTTKVIQAFNVAETLQETSHSSRFFLPDILLACLKSPTALRPFQWQYVECHYKTQIIQT